MEIYEEINSTPVNIIPKSNVLTLNLHNSEVYSIQWSPTGEFIASWYYYLF